MPKTGNLRQTLSFKAQLMRAFLLFFHDNIEWHIFTPGMGRATAERKKVQTLTWTDLASKELNVKWDESYISLIKNKNK